MKPSSITKAVLTTSVLACSALTTNAQVYTPPSTPASPTSPAAGNGNTTIINQKKNAESPYGNEIPFVDPTQETVSIMGHTFNLSDNRLGGQFEAYLADTPNTSAEAIEYRQNIDAILAAISPNNSSISVNQKLRNGFDLLTTASSYSGDGKICDTLANAIYSAMLSKGSAKELNSYVDVLEKEKLRLIRNADIEAAGSKLSEKATKSTTSSKGTSTTVEKVAESFTLQNMQKRILEIEVMQKTHRVTGATKGFQSKIQYQALLAQLFMQRRFEHVVIGTRFYNLIFRDGGEKLQLKKNSDVSKFFVDGLGVEPTISGLDSAANEAMLKVTTLVAAFHNHIGHKELHNGAKRLTEAYALGEYLPRVQSVKGEDRRKILEYVRDGQALVKTMDVHDYTKAQVYLATLKERASDFDSSKAEGAINAYSRIANSHIRAAQIAMAKGDDEKFEQELTKATQIWPTNPKLEEIDKRLDKLIDQSDVGIALLNDFDRLLSEKNYREIFKRQYEFVPVTAPDPERKDAVEQVIKNILRIDVSLMQAKEISKFGNNYAAWEILATLKEEFPKDPELLGELMNISPKVANFTVALNKANQFNENDINPQTGSALTWYLEAKSIYPGSSHAQKAIDEIVEKLLPE